jgi:type II secretory pathway component PulK
MCCLIAVSVLVVNWLKSASFVREQLRSAERRLQADWLVEAALDRAATQLAKNETYTGETWKITAAELGGADSATIEIKVTPGTNAAAHRTIHVAADFPADSLHQVHKTKDITVKATSVKEKQGG